MPVATAVVEAEPVVVPVVVPVVPPTITVPEALVLDISTQPSTQRPHWTLPTVAVSTMTSWVPEAAVATWL